MTARARLPVAAEGLRGVDAQLSEGEADERSAQHAVCNGHKRQGGEERHARVTHESWPCRNTSRLEQGAVVMANFYKDVIKKSPKFTSRKRVADLTLLEPATRKRVRAVIADAKEHGLKLMVFETYRSTQRQTDLFNSGATQLRTVGVHHYGLACDLVRDVNGEPSWKGDFSLLGRLARHHGFIWGGDWGNPNIHHLSTLGYKFPQRRHGI